MAEGIMQHLATNAGLDWHIDSAGTGSWHVGEAPDRRAVSTCDNNGIDISGQRARHFGARDFRNFDLILTMDHSNLEDVTSLAQSDAERSKINSIMNYADIHGDVVPDPYYDGRFDEAFDLIYKSCSAIIQREQKIVLK